MATRKDDKGADNDKGPAEHAAEEVSDIGRRTAEYARHSAAGMENLGGEQMRALLNASTRACRDMTDLSGGDVDIFMQSGARLAKGVQDMSWEWMQYTQNSLRMGLQAANRMMGCRTIEDLVELQRDFLKDSVDTLLQESARLLEMSSHVANDAVSPIAERLHAPDQGAAQQM